MLKNEGSINKIYDSAIESAQIEAQMERNKAISEIEAARAAEDAATDKSLTQAYVNAMKNSRNYNEVQNAYGLGSGNMAQQQLARALGLTGTLTDIRNVFARNDANRGQQQFQVGESFRKAIEDAVASNEKNRANALLDAAEAEEQNLIDLQKSIGSTLAAQGDYSVLGKLYGLTQDQINRLQRTGIYAPRTTRRATGTGGATTLNAALENYYGRQYDVGKNTSMTADEVAALYSRLDTAGKIDAAKKAEDARKEAIVAGNKAAAINNKKKK